MAKAINKNNLLLIISAILIVIALIITISATVYEKKLENPTTADVSETHSSSDTTTKKADNTTTASDTDKAPETTKPQTTKAPLEASGKLGKYKIATQDDPLSIGLNAVSGTVTVGSIPKGTEIEILATYDKWGYVNYNGTGGWVSMDFVEPISLSNTQQSHSTGKYKVTESGNVSLGIKAEIGAPTDGSIPSGAEVEVISACGDWAYIKYQDKMGWLSFNSIEKVA